LARLVNAPMLKLPSTKLLMLAATTTPEPGAVRAEALAAL